MSSSHAVIVGANGLVGQECLRLLLARYDSVTAVVRRSAGRIHPRLVERRIDLARLDTIEIATGAHVYCTLGTTMKKAGSEAAFRKVDYDYPRMLAGRASAAGGARFMLVSSVGADPRSKNFYLRVKGELEEAVRTLPMDAVHILRPSFLIGEREEPRSGEAAGIALVRALEFALAGPLRKYRAIPASTVAAAMVAAANKNASGCFIYHYDQICTLAHDFSP
ncbi:MAG: oxidoreductase [Acidobacteria bacterium]|nr:MAG: oxidoreductase [Acidobacteriota bacterium]